MVGPDNSTWNYETVSVEGCALGTIIADNLLQGSKLGGNPEWELYYAYYGQAPIHYITGI